MKTVVNSEPDMVVDFALDWVIRAERDDFDEWQALTAWLGVNPRHATIYARMQAQNRDVADALAEEAPSILAASSGNVLAERRDRTLSRSIIPLAASLLIISGLATAWHWHAGKAPIERTESIALNTRAGETRAVTLADGTNITLAGRTQLLVADQGRLATLKSGRAMFAVARDPKHPFVVRIGDNNVTDIGTRFDIARREGGFDLAVSEGEVRVTDGKASLDVNAGQGARVRPTGMSRIFVNRLLVGGWQSGRYSYAEATIADVAEDITSATGTQVTAAPDVADHPFAGTLRFEKSAAETLKSVAPALELKAQRHDDGWRLESAADASRP